MGLQLIFCVETKQICKSDQIYIKKTIERFYPDDKGKIKLSWVFMDGRGNYTTAKIKKRLEKNKKEFRTASPNNDSRVIMCFDCDDYDTKQEDRDFLSKAEKYCMDNKYDFVWFCKEIESVYLGKRVPDNMKCKEAEKFARRNMIETIDINSLKMGKYHDKRSNLCSVLDRYM